MYSSTLSLTLAPDGVGGQRYAPAALPPGKTPTTQCTGGLVGPKPSLDGFGKFRQPGYDSRTVQPVASRYTDLAMKYSVQNHNFYNYL